MLQKIHFVKETSGFTKDEPPEAINDLNGEEISEEYKALCQQASSSTQDKKTDKKADKKRDSKYDNKPVTDKPAYRPEDVFKLCQSGDLSALQQWTLSDFDINLRDSFGWTPLMIASVAGHPEVVKHLLDNGADRNCRCPAGKTLTDLCRKFKRHSVITLLDSYSSQKVPEPEELSLAPEVAPDFDCEFCGHVTGTSLTSHVMSIAHQLASKTASSSNNPSLASYPHIDKKAHKGFQMLRQQGWNGTTGLGAREDGRKYPIAVKVRQDRTALGHPKSAKIGIEKLVKPEVKPSTTSGQRVAKPRLKHKLANKDKKDRKVAANFRRDFYDNSELELPSKS